VIPSASNELEFVVSICWSAVTPGLKKAVRGALDEFCAERQGATVIIRVEPQSSEFESFSAAFSAVKRKLGVEGASASSRSIWLMFGDDRCLWHRDRVAECAHAIHRHSALDGVALFATATHVDYVDNKDLPLTVKEVDDFIASGHGWQMDDARPCPSWFEQLPLTGHDSLCMEYFQLCPCFRLVEEFFATTSAAVLAHRYCSLRFAEYLLSYPLFGRELGLEVSWFQPRCWMYFHESRVSLEGQWEQCIENQADTDKESSTSSLDSFLAEEYFKDFNLSDHGIRCKQFVQQWAVFRDLMELVLVPRHCRTLDQRMFDRYVCTAVGETFSLVATKHGDTLTRCSQAFTTLCRAGQDFAKSLAETLQVRVFWHFPDRFMETDFEDRSWAN